MLFYIYQGVLRQIPMIGSMMNWFSPPPKDPVKGRTFNLVSGKYFHDKGLVEEHLCFETIAVE